METSKPNGNPRRAVNGAAAVLGGGGGGGGGTTANGRPLPLPPSKAHYRAAYRPLPPPVRRRRRSRGCCCCVCLLWLTLVLIALVFLAAIAAGVFYVVYHPLEPSFTVSSLRLSALNVTSEDSITSRIDFSVTARNPNTKLDLDYDDVAVTAYSDGVAIGDGAIPGFVHGTGNTTVIKVAVASAGWSLEPTDAADLRKRKGKFRLEIDFDTKVGVWIGGIKTKRVGVRASCDGIEAAVAKGNSTVAHPPASASSPSSAADTPPAAVDSPPAVKCKVKLHIKIFGWTI